MRETLATILWEGWTARVRCAAAVFLPGSEALTFPGVLWPGLVLAAAVPAGGQPVSEASGGTYPTL